MGTTPEVNGNNVADEETLGGSIHFGTAEAVEYVRSLTDVGAMTRLLHECIAHQRAVDVELDELLSQRTDLDRHLLQLQRSSDVRELDLAQSRVGNALLRIDAIVERANSLEGVHRALEAEDYESASRYVQTFLQIDAQYKDSGSDQLQRDRLLAAKKQLEGIVHSTLHPAGCGGGGIAVVCWILEESDCNEVKNGV
ncbi:hypothetical protein V8G54_006115 [Vigna mungo]|uniref:Conserved oligomeric Golgi complex subunit 4 N-terminal domain-containing protein n=1 Tax=Vigna mungo TaxID=3915 RepID=A0AAQ3NZX1_VIGMU